MTSGDDTEKQLVENKSSDENTESTAKPEAEPSSTSCCRTTLRVVGTILLAPVALVVGLVAVLVWVVLAPLKCICPCCSPCLTLVTEALCTLAKLFCRGLGFSCSTTEGDTEQAEEMGPVNQEKSSYGTTEKTEEKIKE